jgi:hypothetical protein
VEFDANLRIEITFLPSGLNIMVSRTHSAKPFTQQELITIAKYQKTIIWLVLLSIAANFMPYATLVMLVTGIIRIYFVFHLAVATRLSAAWLYMVMMFIPWLNLLALLHINAEATKILQSNGIKVGLMGANSADLKKLKLGLL